MEMDPAAVAVAMQELKSVMSAESRPLECVILRADGSTDEVVTDHRDIRKVLKGMPNIVGALLSLNRLRIGVPWVAPSLAQVPRRQLHLVLRGTRRPTMCRGPRRHPRCFPSRQHHRRPAVWRGPAASAAGSGGPSQRP